MISLSPAAGVVNTSAVRYNRADQSIFGDAASSNGPLASAAGGTVLLQPSYMDDYLPV